MLANTSTPEQRWNPLSQWEDDGGPPPSPVPAAPRCVNVGPVERTLSVYVGGSLLTWGLARRSFPGLFVAALGGALIYRGTTGHCGLYETLDMSTADRGPGCASRGEQSSGFEAQSSAAMPAVSAPIAAVVERSGAETSRV